MAAPDRKEFDALAARVSALEAKAAVPVPAGPTGATGATGATGSPPKPQTITTDDGVVLQAPVATVAANATFTLWAQPAATRNVTFAALQLAVRGEGTRDLAHAPATTLKAGQKFTLTGTWSTASGPVTAYVAYSVNGSDWVEGPKTTFTLPKRATPAPVITTPVITTPGKDVVVPGRAVPKAGKSKLPFNRTVFRTTPQAAAQWGKDLGVEVDGFLYFTARQSWGDLRGRWGSGHKDWLDSGRLIVITMPVAPESEGDQMNLRGANDAYASAQKDLAKDWLNAGFNVPNAIFRIGWEPNGNWYRWSCNRPGGVEAYRQSIRNFVKNFRAAGMTQCRFNQCWNKGPGQSSTGLEAFAGADCIDVLGIDQYDMWGPSFSDAQWEEQMNKNPSARSVAELAAKEGISWSWDEGGPTHGNGSAYGGDNPFYIQKVRETCDRYTSNLAYFNTYDDKGAPDTLQHDLARNPKVKAAYLKYFP